LLHGKAVAHVGHIAQVDQVVVDPFHRNVVQLFDGEGAGVQFHGVLPPADFLGAGREDEVFRADGVHHISGEMPFDWQAERSMSTITWRIFPPYGVGMEAPCTVASPTRRKFTPRSFTWASERVLLLRLSCRMGTLEAL